MFRIFMALGFALSGLLGTSRHPSAGRLTARLPAIAARATLLAGSNPGSAIRYLHREGEAAQLGRDGRTILTRVHGRELAILPRYVTALDRAARHALLRPASRSAVPANRSAIVLEPFAAELGLGEGAGAPEAQALQSLGYNVTTLHDSQVTLATMATLPQYSVIYMETHSGVLPDGDAVVATAQTDTRGLDALFSDHSVMQVTVAGDAHRTLYVGITGQYIAQHLGTFPGNSLVYLNGCSALAAPRFWAALQSHGVATLVSWDHDAVYSTEDQAAHFVFDGLAAGDSVSAALQAARSNGVGSSFVGDTTAHLGALGNASLVLTAPKSPPATTPTATATPTATPHAAIRHKRHTRRLPWCTKHRHKHCRHRKKYQRKGGKARRQTRAAH